VKTTLPLVVCLAVLVPAAGCRRAARCTVTAYGPEYLTYTGSGEQFNNACRQVLHELGYKEQLGENRFRHPYHADGGSTHKDHDRLIAARSYLQTKDEAGAEYKITIITLGRRDPIVILESTAPDRYQLINALYAEFAKQGIRVKPY